MKMTKTLSVLMTGLMACAAQATDYYVAEKGNDNNKGSSDAPFATIDKAIITATSSDDVIHVAPGTYETGGYASQTDDAKWGPNLRVKLIGTGTSRDDVVIKSNGEYRTLRMEAGSWLENVTVVGNADIEKVDKGGAIEMNGGTITNCVVRDGTAKGNNDKNAGGNLYINSDAALVVDCEISNGKAKCRGGNVCLDRGTLRNCMITDGATSGGSEQNNGGNVWTYIGKIENCTISGGSAVLGGNVFVWNANALITGGTISGGTATEYGGNVYLREGTISKATVSGGVMTEASSGNYGGGNIYADGNAVVSECVILEGSAYRRGGNVYAVGGATVKDCAITNGICSANIGGNIYMEAATVTNSTVYGGSAPGRAGNIFMNATSSLVVDCAIANGTGSDGGNVYVNKGAVLCSDVINGTATGQGGNIYLNNESNSGAYCADCTIQGGRAAGGGNVFNKGRLTRCSISGGDCTSSNMGGGVRNNGSNALLEDCLIANNSNGGLLQEGSAQIYSCTIVGNAGTGVWGYGPASKATTWRNSVIYDNTWSGEQPTLMTNCAIDNSDMAGKAAYSGCVYLEDASAFVGYANGNYRPTSSSALVDAGATDTRADASTLDLDGNPRTSGQVDIGCYEYQKSEMTVSFAYAKPLEHAYAPVTASFSVSAQNVPDGETAKFTVNYGDGTEADVTTESTVTHTYAQPGVYTITVTASAVGASDATMTYQDFVKLSSQMIYVTKDNANAAFPYDTPETGYASFAAALADAVDGSEIRVGDGVYEQTAKHTVNKAVTICGNLDNPGAVVFRNTATAVSGQGDKRVMAIDNANALVCGLTLEGGQVYHGNGGNLTISAGAISNCVIRGGIAYADTDAEYGMGAGVALSGSGVVTHCVITNNEVRGTGSGTWLCGGAIVFPWGSSGKLSNSLVAGNRWVTGNEAETAVNGSAGIAYHGSTGGSTIDNCTIVANVIDGFCGPDSAAGVRCDWNSAIRNTAIAGNRIGAAVSNVFLVYAEDQWKDRLNTCVTEDALPSGNASCWTATLEKMFRDYSAGDYRPKAGGALFNRGKVFPDVPLFDLMGVKRVFDTADRLAVGTARIDVGCYESQELLGLVITIR